MGLITKMEKREERGRNSTETKGLKTEAERKKERKERKKERKRSERKRRKNMQNEERRGTTSNNEQYTVMQYSGNIEPAEHY